MTNRQKQAMKTRNKIYNAAIKLMQKKGIEQTTIEDICKRANVSIGSFYNYFKSKDEVLYSINLSADEYFKGTVTPELEGLPADEKIIHFFRQYARYNKDTGLDFTKHLYFNSENKYFLDHNRYMHILMKGILEEELTNKRFNPELSLEQLEDLFFLVARGIVSDWCLHDGDYDLEEKTVFYFELLLHEEGNLFLKR